MNYYVILTLTKFYLHDTNTTQFIFFFLFYRLQTLILRNKINTGYIGVISKKQMSIIVQNKSKNHICLQY